MLEHYGSGGLFFILVDHERTAVISEVTVDFLDYFWKDTTFVVVWFAYGVGWTIEKCVFLSGVTVKI